MLKFIKFTIILLLVFNIFSIGILTVSAIEGILPDTEGNVKAEDAGKACNSSNCGNYTLNEMVSVFTKYASRSLGLVGSLALLAFVAGGLMMMLSAGNPEWVTRGKQTIIGAVIGLAIVFTSYMIIQLVFTSLGITMPREKLWSTITSEGGWLK